MAKITIDGVDIDVEEGSSIIAAADTAGVFIPRFCYHPDLSPSGNCRICQVEIEGMPRLVVSCMTPIKDGMVVRTDTDKVKKAVKGDLEFLLLNHPVDCPICDQAGECYLQDYYMAVGQHESRIPLGEKVRKKKVVDLGEHIVLDAERCVLCSRCIRFSDEVTETNQFGFFNRGSKTEIGTFRNRPIEDEYSGCYADVCPVGALTSKDFRFESRVWFLDRTDSVCPHCSTGCNIRIDHKNDEAYRLVPRRNEHVNQSWMCDKGRFSVAELKTGRLSSPLIKRNGELQDADWDAAFLAVTEAIRPTEPRDIVALATPRATCEELWAFRRLMTEAIGTPHLDYRVDPSWEKVDEREDEVLRRADHHPNSVGASLLGMVPGDEGDGVQQALERAARGAVRVLYLLGPELLTCWPDRELVKEAINATPFVVLHDTHVRDEHAGVDVVLPVATYAELDGTFVNYGNRLQRIWRAISPGRSVRTSLDVLAELEGTLTGSVCDASPEAAFAELVASVNAFSGLEFDSIGPLGVDLPRSNNDEEAA